MLCGFRSKLATQKVNTAATLYLNTKGNMKPLQRVFLNQLYVSEKSGCAYVWGGYKSEAGHLLIEG